MPIRRAIIVYSRAGGGHISAARAIASELDAMGQFNLRLVDAYLECGRPPVTLFPAAYAFLSRNHPRLWSAIYYTSERFVRNPNVIIGRFLRAGFARLMRQEHPDLVISVLPAINGLLSEATCAADARLEVVLTDWYRVHHMWVAPGVDHYTAPTESAREECVGFGAPAECVEVVGIPVRREFSAVVDRESIRVRKLCELGLNPRRFTIVAMVGAEGSPRSLPNLARLASAGLEVQLVVVCGRSDTLRRRVEQLAQRNPIKVLGFVEDVADLLRSADVVVTKAGGVTLAEAFCCGVPVVVHDAVPGQETGNLEYVLQQGASRYAERPDDLVQIMRELLVDPTKRAELAQRGVMLARPDAARRIAENVLARLV